MVTVGSFAWERVLGFGGRGPDGSRGRVTHAGAVRWPGRGVERGNTRGAVCSAGPSTSAWMWSSALPRATRLWPSPGYWRVCRGGRWALCRADVGKQTAVKPWAPHTSESVPAAWAGHGSALLTSSSVCSRRWISCTPNARSSGDKKRKK